MKLVFKIPKPGVDVFQYLADPGKFVEVHPVITKMIRNNDNSYRVYERLKVGFFHFRFTYPAWITSHPRENKIDMKVMMGNWATINISFSLFAYGDITWVEEWIDVKSTRLLSGTIKRVLRTQHEKLFENIAAYFHPGGRACL